MFVPNLAILGLLSPKISFGEKNQSPTYPNPAYFSIREPQCGGSWNNTANEVFHTEVDEQDKFVLSVGDTQLEAFQSNTTQAYKEAGNS